METSFECISESIEQLKSDNWPCLPAVAECINEGYIKEDEKTNKND